MQVVLISGLSGSGKSIALNVLEDSGYYCVDNLPAPLLSHLVGHLRAEEHELVAVAVDMRGGSSIAALPPQLRKLEAEGVTLRFVFLDARDDVLIQRFSETRRRHPLAGDDVTLEEAIARERAPTTKRFRPCGRAAHAPSADAGRRGSPAPTPPAAPTAAPPPWR